MRNETEAPTKKPSQVLIAVALLGALVIGGLGYYFLKYKPESEEAQCMVNMSSIRKAAVSYHGLNNGMVPTSMADLEKEGLIAPGLKCPTCGKPYVLDVPAPYSSANPDIPWVRCADEKHDRAFWAGIGASPYVPPTPPVGGKP